MVSWREAGVPDQVVKGAPVEILKHCQHARSVSVIMGYPSSDPPLHRYKYLDL